MGRRYRRPECRLSPFRRQCQRQVYRRGGFTHATFTGTDRDNVLHAVNSRLILHAFQSGYVMRQFPVDSFRSVMRSSSALHCSFNSSNALCQTNGITSSTCSVSSIQATWCNAFSVVRLCFRLGAENWPVSRRPLRARLLVIWPGIVRSSRLLFCIDKPSADSLPEEYREVLT